MGHSIFDLDGPKKDIIFQFKNFKLSIKNCFVRGSVVRYVELDKKEIDFDLLMDATRKEISDTLKQ